MQPRAEIVAALSRTGLGAHARLDSPEHLRLPNDNPGRAPGTDPLLRARAVLDYRIGLARATLRAPPGLRIDRRV